MSVDAAPDWVAAGTPGPLKAELIALLGADRVLTLGHVDRLLARP